MNTRLPQCHYLSPSICVWKVKKVELLKVKCLPVLLYGLEVCSLTKPQIKSLDYVVSSCYRKIFNVKSNDDVRFCMDMFNCDGVGTLLAKRKQKFLSGLVHLDSILCQVVVVMISNWYPVAYYRSYFITVIIIILLLFVVLLSWWRNKDLCYTWGH